MRIRSKSPVPLPMLSTLADLLPPMLGTKSLDNHTSMAIHSEDTLLKALKHSAYSMSVRGFTHAQHNPSFELHFKAAQSFSLAGIDGEELGKSGDLEDLPHKGLQRDQLYVSLIWPDLL